MTTEPEDTTEPIFNIEDVIAAKDADVDDEAEPEPESGGANGTESVDDPDNPAEDELEEDDDSA
jgi:hypothetical protein